MRLLLLIRDTLLGVAIANKVGEGMLRIAGASNGWSGGNVIKRRRNIHEFNMRERKRGILRVAIVERLSFLSHTLSVDSFEGRINKRWVANTSPDFPGMKRG